MAFEPYGDGSVEIYQSSRATSGQRGQPSRLIFLRDAGKKRFQLAEAQGCLYPLPYDIGRILRPYEFRNVGWWDVVFQFRQQPLRERVDFPGMALQGISRSREYARAEIDQCYVANNARNYYVSFM